MYAKKIFQNVHVLLQSSFII